MNTPTATSFVVLAACTSNNGARAKSLGRFDDFESAKAAALAYGWKPLGLGPERMRAVEVLRADEMGRRLVFTRELDI